MSDHVSYWDTSAGTFTTSYDGLAHRNATSAAKVTRLVPLAVALLLAAILTLGVLIPVSHMWNGGTSTVLVDH